MRVSGVEWSDAQPEQLREQFLQSSTTTHTVQDRGKRVRTTKVEVHGEIEYRESVAKCQV
jgi:hypothetical protein